MEVPEEGDLDFSAFHKNLIKRGDIMGIYGSPMRTKAGELSICANRYKLLTPCVRMMPDQKGEFKDLEKRYRKRYLDLIVNASSRKNFIVRSRIIKHIR